MTHPILTTEEQHLVVIRISDSTAMKELEKKVLETAAMHASLPGAEMLASLGASPLQSPDEVDGRLYTRAGFRAVHFRLPGTHTWVLLALGSATKVNLGEDDNAFVRLLASVLARTASGWRSTGCQPAGATPSSAASCVDAAGTRMGHDGGRHRGGIAAGVVAKAADESGINWAGDLGTHPAIWVAALVVIARFAPTVRWATLRAVGFFVAMCLGYYGWAVVALGFGSGPALTRFLVLWLAMSVTAVPVVAAGMHLAYARDGPVPGSVVATVAGLALLTGGAVWRLGLAALGLVPAGLGLRPVQAAVDVVVALVIAAVLPRHASTRVWALALLLPAGLVVRLLLDLVSARLGLPI